MQVVVVLGMGARRGAGLVTEGESFALVCAREKESSRASCVEVTGGDRDEVVPCEDRDDGERNALRQKRRAICCKQKEKRSFVTRPSRCGS